MPTQSVICTLFEGKYHYGVAALINSVHKFGFKGAIYIGYRGELPFWCKNAISDNSVQWEGATTYAITKDVQLYFLPIDNDYHFTNYKPKFMLDLWKGQAKNADGMFYFDPDIINRCDWNFYEKWITYGVAIVREIVWNDMPSTHPKRQQWAVVAKSGNLTIKNTLNSYFNAGFIGISKKNVSFLHMWDNLINISIDNFGFKKESFFQSLRNSDLFRVGDQDLLNLTAMCTDQPLSEIGPEGMDFIYGGWTMAHATGSPKPWNKNFINSCLKGIPPSRADKYYWENTTGIINLYSSNELRYKKTQLKLASFLSRFYRR